MPSIKLTTQLLPLACVTYMYISVFIYLVDLENSTRYDKNKWKSE